MARLTPSASPTRASATIVAEPELETEVLRPDEGYDGLQLVLGRTRHTQLVTLNGNLHLLEPVVLNGLLNLLRGFLWNPLCECHGAAHGGSRGGLELSGLQ